MRNNNAWWLLTVPCIVAALLLVGAPEFPALERATKSAFAPTPATAPIQVAPAQAADPAPVVVLEERRDSRGALVPLYVSFAALQALDVHSTLTALGRPGTREANPLMAGVVDRPAAFMAVKAGAGAGIIYLAEKLRKRSRAGAMVMMAALNSVYAAVVAHNYRAGK